MEKILFSLVLLITLFGQSLFAQGIEGSILITNETVVGTDYYFDIYINTRSTTSGDIYLADADLRISYEPTVFSSPSFHKKDSVVSVGSAPFVFNFNIGYCSFVPTVSTLANDLEARSDYHSSMALSLSGSNLLSIELPGSSPSDQVSFEKSVARINGLPLTHQLGRFYISGYNGSGKPNLQLVFTGILQTKVFSYENAAPFNSELIDMTQAFLPVEGLSFSAEKINQWDVQLSWETMIELNNERFVIEKKRLGGGFEAIDELAGAGTTNQPQSYQFLDQTPMSEVVVYRLRQIDFDGTFDYSESIELTFDFSDQNRYRVYPNPAHNLLHVETLTDIDQLSEWVIVDMRGKALRLGQIEAGIGSTEINLSQLARGMYVIRLKNQRGLTQLSPFMKL